jgi:hypothetical protein
VGHIRPSNFLLLHAYRNKCSKCLTIVTVVIFIACVTENSADILHSKLTHCTGLMTQTRYCEHFEALCSKLCMTYRKFCRYLNFKYYIFSEYTSYSLSKRICYYKKPPKAHKLISFMLLFLPNIFRTQYHLQEHITQHVT